MRASAPRTAMLKCLTVMQPWATLLAHGLKTYETRSWSPATAARC
jgi:hypothetical protein